MDYPNRGIALIFTFDRLNYSPGRNCNNGMVIDADRLSKTFSECLQFDVHRYSSLNKSDFEEIIKGYSKRNYDNDDCFVCIIRAHGTKNDEVQCADGEHYDTKKLADIFMEVPSLKNKPKIFLFGMCRGSLYSIADQHTPQEATVQCSSAIKKNIKLNQVKVKQMNQIINRCLDIPMEMFLDFIQLFLVTRLLIHLLEARCLFKSFVTN
jgi:hypothetical protein